MAIRGTEIVIGFVDEPATMSPKFATRKNRCVLITIIIKCFRATLLLSAFLSGSRSPLLLICWHCRCHCHHLTFPIGEKFFFNGNAVVWILFRFALNSTHRVIKRDTIFFFEKGSTNTIECIQVCAQQRNEELHSLFPFQCYFLIIRNGFRFVFFNIR